MNINTVTLVNLPASQYISAITNGTVDAIVVFQPVADQIKTQLGSNSVDWSVQNNQPAYLLLACRSNWATQNPDTIVRFLKSLSQAQNYLVNNQASAEVIVEKTLNQTISQETSSQNQFGLSLDQSLLLAMQDESNWLISNNLTNATSIPNFLNYIYFSGLETVNPNLVTIAH